MMGLRFIFSGTPLTSFSGNRRTPWALAEVELDGDGFTAATELLHEFVALEPAVDHPGGCAGVLHVEDDFGAGAEGSTVVDELVAVAFDEAGGVFGLFHPGSVVTVSPEGVGSAMLKPVWTTLQHRFGEVFGVFFRD